MQLDFAHAGLTVVARPDDIGGAWASAHVAYPDGGRVRRHFHAGLADIAGLVVAAAAEAGTDAEIEVLREIARRADAAANAIEDARAARRA